MSRSSLEQRIAALEQIARSSKDSELPQSPTTPGLSCSPYSGQCAELRQLIFDLELRLLFLEEEVVGNGYDLYWKFGGRYPGH